MKHISYSEYGQTISPKLKDQFISMVIEIGLEDFRTSTDEWSEIFCDWLTK